MGSTLVLIHTIPALVGLFATWSRDLLPGTRVLHLLDEPMLERIRQRGTAALEDDERLADHVSLAVAVGADAVLVTCSTVSLSVAAIRNRFAIPVLAIDEPMIAEAVRLGRRIAVVATAPTTLAPTRTLLEAAAARTGRSVAISSRLVEGALPALLAGDGATHDRLVAAAVRESADGADVVVLAQATMARALDALADAPLPVPVLASPATALAEVASILGADPASTAPIPPHEVHP
jgi:Asp/Glu/hydantoin racemase